MKFRIPLVAGLLAAALTGPAWAAVTGKFAVTLSEKTHQGQGVAKFVELVKAKSNGEIDIKPYYTAALGDDGKATSALQGGTIEFTVPVTATLTGMVKAYSIFGFPFLFKNAEEADKVLAGPIGQKLLDSLPAHGLVGLAYWENGFFNATNSKHPIARVEDFAGLKFRSIQAKISQETIKALGANPVPLAIPELYTALETRTIDGQGTPNAVIAALKLNEVQKFLSITRHTYSPFVPLVSKAFWDKLTPAQQKILKDAAVEARTYQRQVAREQSERTWWARSRRSSRSKGAGAAGAACPRHRAAPVRASGALDEVAHQVQLFGHVQRRRVAAAGHFHPLQLAARAGAAGAHLLGGLAQHQVRFGAAQQQHRQLQRVVVVPDAVVVGVVGELANDGRVVVRRHAAVGQAAGAGFREAPPLGVGQEAVGLVGGAKERLQLAHGGERRWLAGVGLDALDGGLRQLRRGVVEHQALDAARQLGLEVARGADGADGAAHRGADPVAALHAQLLQQLARQPGVEGQAVFLARALRPLAQPAPDRVGAEHAPAARRQVRRQLVHVAPRARQAVPGDDGATRGAGVRGRPVEHMEFAPGAAQVQGRVGHGQSGMTMVLPPA